MGYIMGSLKIGFVSLLVLVLVSCGDKVNVSSDFDGDFIISEDSLILLLKDIHIVDAAAKQNVLPNNSNNQVKYKQYKAVLEKHQISRARFDSTIVMYTRHGEKFDALYEKVVEKLTEEEKELDGN